MRQLKLFTEKKYARRKVQRQVARRSPNHVTLKARVPVLRQNHAVIKRVIRATQLRYGVRIRAVAIMENHLHLLIECSSRENFANFLRVLAGTLAQKIGRGKLWLDRAWSRVVRWGRDYVGVKNYILANPIKAGCFCEIDSNIKLRDGVLEGG